MTEKTILHIKQGHSRVVRSTDTLGETNDLATGQIFLTVAKYYEKGPKDYSRWISFEKNRSEFEVINSRVQECASDLEKLHLVCDWLGEEPIS